MPSEEQAHAVERWIQLAGTHNTRDLGGLTRPDQRLTRSGAFLRSDALDRLTADDIEQLVDGYGLAHVIDLRSNTERDERGRGLLGDDPKVRYTEVEVIPSAALAERRARRAAAHESGAGSDTIMAEGYIELLELGEPAFRQVFEAIVASDGAPALFHCAAGKDRTGVLAALLLELVDVPGEVIVADYALTDDRMLPIIEHLTGARSFEELAAQVPVFSFQAKAATMSEFLRLLDARWGGARGYLDSIGVSSGDVAAVATLLD